MKKTIAAIVALASAAVFAGANDLLVMFSTPGPDKYADGRVVIDGEFYALVWTASDGLEKIVLSRALAKDGKCDPFLFIVDENDVGNYKNGSWGVYLLDTRNFTTGDGTTLSEPVDGKPVVNTKAAVKDGIVKSSGFESAIGASSVTPGMYVDGIPTPEITGIKVDDAKVLVTVANTVPFVGYTLMAGSDSKNFAIPEGIGSKNGNETMTITLEIDKKSDAQFFKVSTIR